MLPSDVFEVAVVWSSNERQAVEVTHRSTGRSASASVQPSEVGSTIRALQRQIAHALLGSAQDVVQHMGKGAEGDIVFAEHIPTGARTRVYPRGEVTSAALFDELFRAVAHDEDG